MTVVTAQCKIWKKKTVKNPLDTFQLFIFNKLACVEYHPTRYFWQTNAAIVSLCGWTLSHHVINLNQLESEKDLVVSYTTEITKLLAPRKKTINLIWILGLLTWPFKASRLVTWQNVSFRGQNTFALKWICKLNRVMYANTLMEQAIHWKFWISFTRQANSRSLMGTLSLNVETS